MEKTKVTYSFGNDEYGLQTGKVKISELHDFKGHPFKVEQELIAICSESISSRAKKHLPIR